MYLTGIVRDKQGRKMSKSLGNSPDPIKLMENTVPMVFVWVCCCVRQLETIYPFDEGLCEQGRNFSNKIWNASRLIKGWEVEDIPQAKSAQVAISWFQQKLNKAIAEINASYAKYRISEALMLTYKLVWDDFCSWYLEMVKPAYQQPMDTKTFETTVNFLDDLLKLLHPFMPFLSEELWHVLKQRAHDLIVTEWPKSKEVNHSLLNDFEVAAEVISVFETSVKQKHSK